MNDNRGNFQRLNIILKMVIKAYFCKKGNIQFCDRISSLKCKIFSRKIKRNWTVGIVCKCFENNKQNVKLSKNKNTHETKTNH